MPKIPFCFLSDITENPVANRAKIKYTECKRIKEDCIVEIVKREDLENRQVRLTIHVDTETWKKALADAYEANKHLFPTEEEPTREALEAKYGSDVLYQEAVNATYPQALVAAISQEDLLIAGSPALEIVTIDPESYTFCATMDLYPEVKLGQYKNLTAAYPPVELSEEDTVGAINEYLRENTISEHPEKAAMGDQVSIDFEGFVDGVPFEGGKAQQYPLILGSGMFIPGFEEQVVGITVGGERDVAVIFPAEYTPELSGKAAIFKIKCHEIIRQIIPELTEEFAREQGYDSLSALRQQIMSDRLEIKAAEAMDAYSDALIQQVIDSMEVEIPEAMVTSQLDGLVEELRHHMEAQGMQLEQYLEAAHLTEEDLRNHSREQALVATRYELAMTEIARLENITISQKDLDDQYAQMSAMYGIPAEQLRQQLPPVRLSHDMKLARARAIVVETGKKA